jgi:hypothetical protein
MPFVRVEIRYSETVLKARSFYSLLTIEEQTIKLVSRTDNVHHTCTTREAILWHIWRFKKFSENSKSPDFT